MTATAHAPLPDAYAPSTAPATRPCPNCSAAAVGNFCHECGMRVDAGRITLRALVLEVVAQFAELDHGVLHTTVAVARRPGEMIRGYLNGRRRGFTSPMAFATLSAAMALLVGGITPEYQRARDRAVTDLPKQYHDMYTPKQLETFANIQLTISHNRLAFLAFMLVPTMLAMRWLFRKHRLNLAEHGVFLCYTLGTATFITLVLTLPFALMAMAQAESYAFMLITAIILVRSARGVFGATFSSAWRVLAAFFLGLLGMEAILIAIPYMIAR